MQLINSGSIQQSGYSYFWVFSNGIRIKFSSSINVSLLSLDNFTLIRKDELNINGFTPLVDVFHEIDVSKHYNSLVRELNLYFNAELQSGQTYHLNINGIQNVTGWALPPLDGLDSPVVFTLESDITAAPPPAPPAETFEIKDHSVKAIKDFIVLKNSSSTLESGISLTLSLNPDLKDLFYLNSSEGKIEITFSSPIASNYLVKEDFLLEEKQIGSGSYFWRIVETQIGISGDSKIVTIFVPEANDPTLYSNEPNQPADAIYWKKNYKYRLTINPSIGL